MGNFAYIENRELYRNMILVVRKYMKKIILIISVLVVSQFALLNSASAVPGSADLAVHGYSAYLGGVYVGNICNQGDETVSGFDLNASSPNYDIERFIVLSSSGTTATDLGSIDEMTGVWSGVLADSQCIDIAVVGTITSPVGDNINLTVTVNDSTLLGSTPNIDPNLTNNEFTIGPVPIVELPDIAMSTSLLTQGTLSSGSTVSYEVTISNVGVGVNPAHEAISIAFLVPSYASFSDTTDADTNDALDLTGCSDYGPPSNAGSGLSVYSGSIVLCDLDATSDLPSNTSYNFIFNMTATSDFLSGGVQVHGIASAQDVDSLDVQLSLMDGGNPFVDFASINNIVTLTYDTDALAVTINRCVGQGSTTTTGNGCFTVGFNKLIFSPSFTQSDLVLNGGGSVSEFTQVDEYTWKVDVTGIQPGTTLALTLGANSVQDYSAVQNGVEVLGENTIRFEALTEAQNPNGNVQAPGNQSPNVNTAHGTLAQTGINFDILYNSIFLLVLGICLNAYSRRKRNLEI